VSLVKPLSTTTAHPEAVLINDMVVLFMVIISPV